MVTSRKKSKKILERELGTSLTKQNLVIGKNSGGEEIEKEFDLVSNDKKTIVEIKSYKLGNNATKDAGYTTTRRPRLISACFYLRKVKKATQRILVLTNKDLYLRFKKDMDGLLDSKIELRHIPFKAKSN